MNDASASPLRQALSSAIALGLFGILGATLVAVTWSLTAERIAYNERQAFLRNVYKLVPRDRISNDLLQDVITIRDPRLSPEPLQVYRAREGDRPLAVVYSPIQTPGYAGPIRLMVAVLADGTLGGVRVLAHAETPGLGDRIDEQKSDWILSFAGKSLGDPPLEKWKVKKDGGVFDQFTGATITPRKVVDAVRRTLLHFRAHRNELFSRPTQPLETTEAHS